MPPRLRGRRRDALPCARPAPPPPPAPPAPRFPCHRLLPFAHTLRLSYGTRATDLLAATEDNDCDRSLRIARRDGGVVVEGLSRRPVASRADVAALVATGVRRRRTASQQLNSASSRSHAVLTFYVEGDAVSVGEGETGAARAHAVADVDGGGGGDAPVATTMTTKHAKLMCVDLAGSEVHVDRTHERRRSSVVHVERSRAVAYMGWPSLAQSARARRAPRIRRGSKAAMTLAPAIAPPTVLRIGWDAPVPRPLTAPAARSASRMMMN